jgi:hypothetical protein
VQFEQLETPEGIVLRSSPTPEEWRKSRLRLILAASGLVILGAGGTALALATSRQPGLFAVMPLIIGVLCAVPRVHLAQHARPTAVVATDHSLRLERLDGSRFEELDLSLIGSIRIGPNGFPVPWRWMKGSRDGMVLLRKRVSDQSFVIPAPLASHPVTRQLLARILVSSRARGPVSLVGPPDTVREIESLARTSPVGTGQDHVPPITIPAGWHPDPSGAAPLRWWDGRAWTEHTKSA